MKRNLRNKNHKSNITKTILPTAFYDPVCIDIQDSKSITFLLEFYNLHFNFEIFIFSKSTRKVPLTFTSFSTNLELLSYFLWVSFPLSSYHFCHSSSHCSITYEFCFCFHSASIATKVNRQY